jgi:hypothetical protein
MAAEFADQGTTATAICYRMAFEGPGLVAQHGQK